jgi:hypothetical protein
MWDNAWYNTRWQAAVDFRARILAAESEAERRTADKLCGGMGRRR